MAWPRLLCVVAQSVGTRARVGVPTVTEQNRTLRGRSWDRLASQGLSPSVSQGTIWRYVAVDGRLGYA